MLAKLKLSLAIKNGPKYIPNGQNASLITIKVFLFWFDSIFILFRDAEGEVSNNLDWL